MITMALCGPSQVATRTHDQPLIYSSYYGEVEEYWALTSRVPSGEVQSAKPVSA